MALNESAETITQDISASSWQNSPAVGDAASNGATRIRETRKAIREHFSQEHVLGEDGTGGKHVEGSAKIFVQDGEPSAEEDYEKGRVWYDSGSLRVADGNSYGDSEFLPGLNAYTGLIAMSVKIPTPATDGWALCNGDLKSDTDDNGIWANLIDVLCGGSGTEAYLPDLQNQFVRGVDAEGSRAPELDGSDNSFHTQDHAFEDHKHPIDHTHAEEDFTVGSPVYTAGDHLTADGVLTIRDPDAEEKGEDVAGNYTAKDSNVTVDLDHDHTITLAGYEDDSGLAADSDYGDANPSTETRPDNVALYYVIKL